MIERAQGGITEVNWMNTSFGDNIYTPEVYIRWTDKWTGEELNILFMRKEEAKKVIQLIQKALDDMDEHEKKIQQIIAETDFRRLYKEFEDKYNPYPVQMSRESAFRHAMSDGLITRDLYDAAARFYKGLWSYVGD